MSELERMRSSIAPTNSAEKVRSERKAELKQLSINRVQHWPNTLEANRTKKLSIMKDREAQEELKRQEIDIEVILPGNERRFPPETLHSTKERI